MPTLSGFCREAAISSASVLNFDSLETRTTFMPRAIPNRALKSFTGSYGRSFITTGFTVIGEMLACTMV